jgi:cytochrome c-type biogenesis protein CcmH/NrfG
MGGFAQRHKMFQWATLLVTGVLLTFGYQELQGKYGIPEQLKQAQLALDRRDYPGAIALLEKYAQKNPNNDQIWNMLGALYAETNQREKAISAFQKSLAINPDSQGAKRALSQLQEEYPSQK